MNRSVTVSVECANVLHVRADVLVLKYADGLYGADGATYQRLTSGGATINLPKTGGICLPPEVMDGGCGGTKHLFEGIDC